MTSLPADFERPDSEGDYDDRLMENVDEVGWHYVVVSGDDEGPGFVFTIGLFQNREHPELIVVGLPPETANGLLDILMLKIFGENERIEPFRRYDDVAKGLALVFVPVGVEHYRDYLGYANWYYGALPKPYPALQLVWPDKGGRFPWEEGYDRAFDALQPVLAELPH